MREPGLAGRGLRALVLLAPVRDSGAPPPRALAAGALCGAPVKDRESDAGDGVVPLSPTPGGAPKLRVAGLTAGHELLGNRPTLRCAWPGSPAGAAAAQAAAATAPRGVGGTLVRHEVTAAHTRSLFCSLQLFFSPLDLIVAIPIVPKNSWCVATQQDFARCLPYSLLSGIVHPKACLAAVAGDSLSTSGRCERAPISHPGCALLCLEILTAPQLLHAKWSQGPLPAANTLLPGCALPALLAESGARPLPHPQAVPSLPSPWRVGRILRG